MPVKLVLIVFILLQWSVSAQVTDTKQILESYSHLSKREQFRQISAKASEFYKEEKISESTIYNNLAYQLGHNLNIKSGLEEVCLQLSFLNHHVGNFPEALKYANESIALCRKNNLQKPLVEALASASLSHMRLAQYDSARFLLDEAKILSEKLDYTEIQPSILSNLAAVEHQLGNKKEAIIVYQELADYYESNHDFHELAIVLNNMAEINKSIQNFAGANEKYRRAIELSIETASYRQAMMHYSNYANCLLEQDSFDLAKHFFNEALAVKNLAGDTFMLAIVYSSIGQLHLELQNPKLALTYLDSSIQLCRMKDYRVGLLKNSISQAKCFLALNQYPLALNLLNQSLQVADSLKIYNEKMEIYRQLYKVHKAMNDYDLSLHYLELRYQIKDSILLEEKNQNILYLQSKYEKEKREKEIISLQQTILLQTNKARYYWLAILLVSLVFSSLIYVIILKKRKKQLDHELMKKDNDLLKKDIEYKNKELTSNALLLANSFEQTISLVKQIDELYPFADESIRNELKNIQIELSDKIPNQAWKDFEEKFEQVHQDFFINLRTKYPALTPNELKICSLLRLNLTTKEIALLMNRTSGTIDNARSTIRKKMQLSEDDNLISLLIAI